MSFLYKIVTILIYTLLPLFIVGQAKSTAFTVSLGYGQFTPHKKSMSFLLQKKSPSIEFSLENRNNDSIRYGITVSALNSGNPDVIGMIYGLNGFSSFPLGKKKESARIKIGIGIGYVENIFDANLNNQNIATGSHINSKIVLRTEKEIKLSNNNLLNIGFGVCHFSNGSFQTPNLGLNFLMANIAYSYLNTKSQEKTKEQKNPFQITSINKWQYSLVLSYGVRENVHPMRNKYSVVNFSNRINYLRKPKNYFAGGIDITYNPGIKHTSNTALAISPFQSGIFIGNELNHGRLAFTIDMGIYTFNQNLRSLFYHRFTTVYILNKKIQLLFQLKSHWAVAEAFEIGLKFKIK